MSKPIYRRGNAYANYVRKFIYLAAHEKEDAALDRYTLALIRAIRERVTARELQCLTGYYIHQYPIAELALRLEVNISTISRNIHRGEQKLDSLLRLAEKISPIRFDRTA